MAVASEAVVTLGGMLTTIVSDFVAVMPSASERVTVKVWLEAVLPTVPVIAPVAGFKLSPVGSAPAVIDHVKGAVPPVLARVWE